MISRRRTKQPMLSRENFATSKAHGKTARTAGERWSSGPKITFSLNSWAGYGPSLAANRVMIVSVTDSKGRRAQWF